MKMPYRFGPMLMVLLSVTSVALAGQVQLASATPEAPVIASFNGGTLNLSQGWGTAKVCDVSDSGTICFPSESSYEDWYSSPAGQFAANPLTSCSSGLNLYQNISYGGDELIVTSTLQWINLADYSFANQVSSYKVGACSIIMTDGTNGSGNVYPGATTAGSDVSWIGAAWNDRVQSVYIN